jgi:hypothetical protein
MPRCSATLPFVIPSEAGFPATLHWTQPRVRFSVGENRMKSVNANKINRKSGEAEGSAVCVGAGANLEVIGPRFCVSGKQKLLGPQVLDGIA